MISFALDPFYEFRNGRNILQLLEFLGRKQVFKIFPHNDVGLRIFIYEYSASHIATLE